METLEAIEPRNFIWRRNRIAPSMRRATEQRVDEAHAEIASMRRIVEAAAEGERIEKRG